MSKKVVEDPLIYGQCALIVDGMSMRAQTEYDPSLKREIGKVDYGFGPVGDVDATDALVFMCVGLHGGWSLPVGYVLASRCK